ncbi:hypothetical protein QI113_12015 [Staphylococcus saprophyticus]|nr:hypothetical protein [Staphylococcus saprophyticus]MCM3121304.1 hypothetical protein [Staphylococcus saprophyticus]MDW4502914.1 hypothetical protein [Staphylococcus saprophyticus]
MNVIDWFQNIIQSITNYVFQAIQTPAVLVAVIIFLIIMVITGNIKK